MKNYLKILAVVFVSAFIYSSCGKDDDKASDLKEIGKGAIYKMELSNNRYYRDFEANLIIGILGSDPNENVGILGEQWNQIDNLGMLGKAFIRQGNLKEKSTYITSGKVKSFTITLDISPKDYENNSSLITTIKIFRNDKLVRTETINTSNHGNSLPFVLTLVDGVDTFF